MKLTKTVIDKTTYPQNARGTYILWDDDVSGFGVRIYPTGRKVFVIGYRHHGRWRIITLGKYGILTLDQARKMAREKLVDVVQGKDPAEEKARFHQGPTMKELAHDYLERHAKPHKRSWDEDEKRIDRVIIPSLGKRLVASITRHDIASLHEKTGKTAPYEANRILALLSVMFEFARRMGYVPDNHSNPARCIEKFKEQKRDRWVKPEEMPRLAEAIDSEPNIYVREALWLYILTGARKSELLQAKWEDIDFARGELRLPRTKAGRIHYVPLSKAAIEILQSIPKLEGNPFILPGVNGKHLVNIDKAWGRIRKAAGLEDVRLHDLRRTVGSWLATSGHSLHLIGKILNHSNVSTTEIYAHLSDDPVKRAMEEHGEKVLSIVRLRGQVKDGTQ